MTDALSLAAANASAAGILVVAAAGNSGAAACTIGSPAAVESVLTVGNMADLGPAGFRLHTTSGRGEVRRRGRS